MIELRRMTEIDVQEIAALERDIFSDAWSEKSILETLQFPGTLCVTAEENDEICGYLLFYVVAGEGEIVRFAVSETARRKGVGRHLISWLEAACTETKICRWLLEVRESNTVARSFYENCGFEEDGIRKNFYTDPIENAILMSCALGSQYINEEALPSRRTEEEQI